MKDKLSTTTEQVIKDLQDDLEQMLGMDSNIEVVWRLERLANEKALIKSANLIRKALK